MQTVSDHEVASPGSSPQSLLVELLAHTPPETAAHAGYIEMLERRVAACADLHGPIGVDGQHAFHLAVQNVHHKSLVPRVFRMLAHAGAEPAARNDAGDNALHLAVRLANLEACRWLADCGLDVNAPVAGAAETPLDLACRSLRYPGLPGADKSALEIIRLLVKHGAKLAETAVTVPSAGLLLACGADSQGQPGDCFEAVQLLIEAGASPSASEVQSGRQPLHYAVAKGYWRTVAVLLKAGADVTARDGEGLAPSDYVDRMADASHELRAVVRAAEMQRILRERFAAAASVDD